MARKIYWIGPESSVYHDDPDCPRLNTPNRYWEIHSASPSSTRPETLGGTSGLQIYRSRRPCRVCGDRLIYSDLR